MGKGNLLVEARTWLSMLVGFLEERRRVGFAFWDLHELVGFFVELDVVGLGAD